MDATLSLEILEKKEFYPELINVNIITEWKNKYPFKKSSQCLIAVTSFSMSLLKTLSIS